MKLSGKRSALHDAIQLAASVVPSRTAIPTVLNLLLKADEKLEVSATDLEVGLTLTVPDVKIERKGSLALPALRLAGIFREAAEESDAKIEADGYLAHVGLEGARYKLVGMDPADYPAMPSFEEHRAVAVEAQDLQEMIRKTEFAVSQEGVSYAMTGIYLELKGHELRLSATDGKRLALVRRKSVAKEGKEGKEEKSKGLAAIVPPKAMKLLDRVLTARDEVVHLNLEENQIRFRTPRGSLTSRLLEGKFPDYEKVIPKEGKHRAGLEVSAFGAALRRTALLAPEGQRAVRFTFQPGKLELFARSPDVGEARVEVAAEYSGEPFEVLFNPDYVLDYLRVVDEGKIELWMNERTTATLFRGGKDYTYVLMPLQVTL